MKFLALLLTITACGTYEIPETNVKTVEAEDDASELETLTPKADDETSDPDVSVNVEVNVEVSVSTEGDEDDEGMFLIYDPTMKTWQDAVDSAPDGYRIPTRSEILTLIELYDLGNDVVWTSQQYKNNEYDVWVVNLKTETMFSHCACLLHETIYVSWEE